MLRNERFDFGSKNKKYFTPAEEGKSETPENFGAELKKEFDNLTSKAAKNGLDQVLLKAVENWEASLKHRKGV